MAPRRRKEENRDYPEGLYKRTHRGKKVFYFVKPDGKEKWFKDGTTELEAIRLTEKLNSVYRGAAFQQAMKKMRSDKFNIPLFKAIPQVIEKVKLNKVFGKAKFRTFELDCERLVKLHGNISSKLYNQQHVTEFLNVYVVEQGKSNLVYNQKLAFLRLVGKWLLDMSFINENFAENKAQLSIDEKKEQPLQMEHFKAIYNAAPFFLKVAMALSFNTTHAVQEIYRCRYKDCAYLDEPMFDEQSGLTVHGYLRIHRLKVEKKHAAHVEVPITDSLLEVIKFSRTDRVLSPYIVHKNNPETKKMNKECDHRTQVSRRVISSTFSEVRDSLDLDLMIPNPNKKRGDNSPTHIKVKMADADIDFRPGFHGCRGLASRVLKSQGIDPQSRMAHTDGRSTKVYTENKIEWVRVPAANMRF